MSFTSVKYPLTQINRVNLYLIKTYYKRRVKYKVKWTDKEVIFSNMLGSFYQILDRLYWKTKFANFHQQLIVLLYVVLAFPVSCILLFLLRLLIISEKEEDEEEVVIAPIKVIKTNDFRDKEFLEHFNFSLVDSEEEFKIENPLVVISDEFNGIYDMNDYAKKSLQVENAGGASEISEAWSIHHLVNKVKAISCIFEMEVVYWCKYKMIDYILEMETTRIGVSVVRAMSYYDNFTIENGIALLNKKINGLIISRTCIIKNQCFYESILHILSPSKYVTEILLKCLDSDEFDPKKLGIIGLLTIWITTTDICEIFKNK